MKNTNVEKKLSMNAARERIKAKMLASKPGAIIEAEGEDEQAFVSNPANIIGLIMEITSEREGAQEEGLMAMAGNMAAEPEYGWHCNCCGATFLSSQQKRGEDKNGGAKCPICTAEGQYTYPTVTREPDHRSHLLKQVVNAAKPSYEEVVAPLMQYLADHHHPHVTVIVTSTTAEMVEGLKSFNTNEFIKD